MPDDRIGEFKLLSPAEAGDGFLVYQAEDSTGQLVRLILFDPSVSASRLFRAAFRKDQPRLAHVNHPHILSPIKCGEHNGQFYYITECGPERTLRQALYRQHAFAWDELIDITWQIASALQHLHNLGLSAGRLTPDNIRLSGTLRATLSDTGISNWVNASHSEDDPHDGEVTFQMTEDLRQLGDLMSDLFSSDESPAPGDGAEDQLPEIQDLIATLRKSPRRLIARDVQGRLGNLLLELSGESIELLDRRQQRAPRRSAIMDDLFDDFEEHPQQATHASRPARPGRRRNTSRVLVWIVLAIACLAIAFKLLT